MNTVRGRNMRERRARILAAARGLLANGGYEAMNLRDVARFAAVTVPTIYNLVGNKEEVLVALFSDVLTEVEARMQAARQDTPLGMAEAVVLESVGLFSEDEDYYRSAFLAVEYLAQSAPHHDKVAQIYAWGERLTTAGFIACQNARLLRGRIDPALLGELILRAYRTSCRAWAFGRMSVEEFRSTALRDVYVTLAADAVESFHALLAKKVAALAAPEASPSTQRSRRTKENRR